MRVVRGGGEGSATVSAGYSRRRPATTTPLPTLFEELEPVETIDLGHRVAERIRTDVAWTLENVGVAETGGWLLGRSRDYVLQATVPGSDSYATRWSIDLGYEQVQRAQRQHGGAVLGCWHSNPTETASPATKICGRGRLVPGSPATGGLACSCTRPAVGVPNRRSAAGRPSGFRMARCSPNG